MNNSMSLMERVVDGGQIVILGLLIVFSVLALLWGVLALFKVFFYDIPESRKNGKVKKSKEIKEANKETAQPGDDELIAVLTAAVMAHQNNDEIIAVLTAAVTAYRSEQGEDSPFRVVAFKRAGTRAWNRK